MSFSISFELKPILLDIRIVLSLFDGKIFFPTFYSNVIPTFDIEMWSLYEVEGLAILLFYVFLFGNLVHWYWELLINNYY